MTESTPSGKDNVQKIGSRAGKKTAVRKKRTRKADMDIKAQDLALIDQLAQSLFSRLLNDEPQPTSGKKSTATAHPKEGPSDISRHVALVSRGKAIGVRNLNTTHRIELICQAIANRGFNS